MKHWLPGSVTLMAGGVGGAAATQLIGVGELAGTVAVGGIAAGAAVGVFGHRGAQRSRLERSLIEALHPVVGKRSNISLRKWQGWPGTPTRIHIHYDPTAKDSDPTWLPSILDTVQRRLAIESRVTKHDRRRRRVTLEAGTATESASDPDKERVARTISDLLGQSAKVADVCRNSAGITQVDVRHIPTTKVASSPGYRAKIERTFGTVLAGRWRCRWDLQEDSVTFQLRPEFPKMVALPRLDVDPGKDVLRAYDKVAIGFGVDEDGTELVWRPAIDPNLMVVGAPGTGKTVLEHNVLCSITQAGWPVWVVDGKAIEFLGWRDWPNVQVVASKVEEQVAVITRAHEVMEHRYQLIVSGKASEDDFEPLMLFIDEWSDFRANLLDWYAITKVKGMPTKPRVLQKVASLARKGRSSRVHLLFATQRPDAEYFGGDMRDNFRMRISMGRLSPQGAMMMWQDPNVGTTVPRGCRGRATTISDDNRAVEVQTYYVPDPRKASRKQDEQQLCILEGLLPAAELQRHQRLLIVPPTDQDISDAGDSEYNAWCQADWATPEARPDLDPLRTLAADSSQARELASPTAMFGLPTPASNTSDELASIDHQPADEPVHDIQDDYQAAEHVDPLGLSIGDLVELEPGHWVTLDEEPEEDSIDPTAVVLCWRDDEDNTGVHSLSAGETINARSAHLLATEAA